MKRFFFCIFSFLLFFNTIIFAQSITWQRTYDGIDHVADHGYDICKADGDNIYIAGYTTFLPNRKHIYILKLNPYGDTIWIKTINLGTNGGEIANSIVSSGDGGCVFTGDAGFSFSLKLDLSGNIIWNKNYGGFFKQCYDIIKTSDGGYIACGRDAEGVNEDTYVLKIDSLGNLQWHKTFYSTYWKGFECIEETNNHDGYLIGGYNSEYPGDTVKGIIFKINLLGDSLWEKRYSYDTIFSVYSIRKINNGYIIAGNNYTLTSNRDNCFARINETGDITLFKTLQGTNLKEYFGDFEIINSNRYVIASTRDSIVAWYGHVIVTDSSGNIIAERIYPSLELMVLKSVLPIPNGDIVFTGTVDFNYNYSRDDIYVLRTDSLLNAPPPIGINTNSEKIPVNFVLFQNYPNPFNPLTSIKYEIPNDANIKLTVYDIMGREILSINEYRQAGVYTYMFDGTNIASGVYIYKLVVGDNTNNGGEFTETRKMVLIK